VRPRIASMVGLLLRRLQPDAWQWARRHYD
jgi:hypothetical protein